MERAEAKRRLEEVLHNKTDLYTIAQQFGLTIQKPEGGINKGWAGQAIERVLGIQLNSSRAPNMGSWELKVIPLYFDKTGQNLIVKETMAITMIDSVSVLAQPFQDSHLYQKLNKALIVARVVKQGEFSSTLYRVAEFDLAHNPTLYAAVERDYEAVRQTIRDHGYDALTGKMGEVIQPRTKGKGHGSLSRAFYARTALVAYILGLSTSFRRGGTP